MARTKIVKVPVEPKTDRIILNFSYLNKKDHTLYFGILKYFKIM